MSPSKVLRISDLGLNPNINHFSPESSLKATRDEPDLGTIDSKGNLPLLLGKSEIQNIPVSNYESCLENLELHLPEPK